MRKHRFLPALLLLASCQAYHPAPLSETPDLLAKPDSAIITQQAALLERPYLRPVAIDLREPLDGNAIATLAVLANPDLKAERTRAGIADAQSFAARLLPDPTFSMGAGKVLSGPDVLADLVGALGFDLNALRTRGVRGAQADAAAKQVRLDLAWSEWQMAGAARIQAVRTNALRHIVELERASRDQAQSLFDRNQRAASRGDISGAQLETARLALADANDKYRTGEADLQASRYELARLLGMPPETELPLVEEPLPDRPLDAAALFTIAQANRTDLGALKAGYSVQEAALRKAILDQFPSLNLTVNANRDTGGNFILGPALDFTLPLWNRNRGGIAIEKATREALHAEYDARLFKTRAEIAAAVAGIETARRQRAIVLDHLPAVERLAASNRRAAERGDISVANAETATQALRDQKLLLAQSEQTIAEQMIALELLTGTLREAW